MTEVRLLRDNLKFCCESMEQAINVDKIIYYGKLFRQYSIDIDELSTKAIFYCPWCSSKIPSSLNREYFDILKNEHGIETPDTTNFTNVPEEFKTDKWWKKHGL